MDDLGSTVLQMIVRGAVWERQLCARDWAEERAIECMHPRHRDEFSLCGDFRSYSRGLRVKHE